MLFGLTIRQLSGIRDSYGNIIVTTYANFYQNEKLVLRQFDLVVYDECHYLNQNAKGEQTVYFETHSKVAKLPNYANELARGEMEPYPDLETFGDNYEGRRVYRQMVEEWEARYDVLAKSIFQRTKVLYLSATPFAYHKSLKYMDGTLWHFSQFPGLHQKETSYSSYNQPNDGFEAFLCDRLGYRMNTNKCTIPETGVDVSLLERKLFEDSVKEGIMSTRQLFLEHDYSREFIRVESEMGYRIDEGIKMCKSHEFSKEFPTLYKYIDLHFNYLFINQILEMTKSRAVIPRIQKHIALGRKVVVFHSYNHGYISHPFRFNAENIVAGKDDLKYWVMDKLWAEINKFSQQYPELWNMDMENLMNVRETLSQAFGNQVAEFNGKVAKGKRGKNGWKSTLRSSG